MTEILYRNKVTRDTLFDVILGLIFLTTSGWMIYKYTISEFEFPPVFVIISLFIFIGVHPLILFLNYYIYGKGREIIIQPEKNQITVIKNRESTSFKIENIEFVEIHKSASLPRYGLSFSYVKFYLKSKEIIIITSLMTNHFFIPKTLPKPSISKTFFPLINKGYIVKNSKEYHHNRLVGKYNKYSTTKLQEIAKSKHYHSSAKNVAKKVLENRKLNLEL